VPSLVVIIGAGASFDCSGPGVELRNLDWRPPLVTELFDTRARFARVLHEYRLAEMAAADIRPAIRSGAVAIERFLRERLRESDDPYARRRFRQVPLYLQELLFNAGRTNGRGFTQHPDNYDALINAALALEDVVFISLNYDTLLDRRLFAYPPGLHSLDAYISPDPNWCLIKLHGSVNWGRPLTRQTDAHIQPNTEILNSYFDQAADDEIGRDIVLRNHDVLDDIRYEDRRLYYPALSVPLGSTDELVCPPHHVAHLERKLRELPALNLLVIGYSGLDQEVLRLLRDAGRPPTVLRVVNGDSERGALAAMAINQQFGSRGSYLEHQVFDGGFSEFVADGHLSRFISELR
jgi:hypothetical protein